MKKVLIGAVCGLICLMAMSCTTVTYETLAVTNNTVGTKVGEVSVLQGGAYQAAKNGGLTKIAIVEKKTVSVGFMGMALKAPVVTYVVTGE